MTVKPFRGFGREAEPGWMKSDSAEGMSPSDLILFSSCLEMVDALQSRPTLDALVVTLEPEDPFFLPMVAELVEAEARARRRQVKKMSSMET
jgi:hypothetical protein